MAKDPFEGWSPADVAEYQKLEAEVNKTVIAAKAAVDDALAARSAPAAKMATMRAELAAKRAELARVQSDAAADEVYAKAILTYGGEDRVAIIRARRGSIVMRPLTEQERDMTIARAAELKRESERDAIGKESTTDTVLYPSREEFEAWVTEAPGLWATVVEAREKLISGLREETEKKG